MKVINYIVRKISIYVLLVLSNIIFPHRVYGKKNIPKGGAYLLYGNHVSMIDVVFIFTIFRRTKPFYMGKEELFKNPMANWYFGLAGGFPVKRGTADMAAIRQCVKHIKEGNVMVIFPEGTRNQGDFDKLQKFHNGAALVLHNSKAPALPMYIENKKRMRLFSFTNIYIGEMLDMSEYNNKKLTSQNLDACTNKLKEELGKLMKNAKKL